GERLGDELPVLVLLERDRRRRVLDELAHRLGDHRLLLGQLKVVHPSLRSARSRPQPEVAAASLRDDRAGLDRFVPWSLSGSDLRLRRRFYAYETHRGRGRNQRLQRRRSATTEQASTALFLGASPAPILAYGTQRPPGHQ